MNWISVKDRLPEKEQSVLICQIDRIDSAYGSYTIKQAYFNGKLKFIWCSCCSDIQEPTHWMPIPKDPVNQ